MIKRLLPWFFILIFGIFMILLFTHKDSLNMKLSEMVQEQVAVESQSQINNQIDSLYNYFENSQPYKITFLEFGATGCVSCLKMEKVMADIKENHGNRINVVFINTRIRKNRELMQYFGIVEIPTQILLDRSAIEFFRHTGFISTDDLLKKIKANE